MTCYGILRPKSPPPSLENLSLCFASLINRSTSSFVDTTMEGIPSSFISPISVDLWANKSWNFPWQVLLYCIVRITERATDDNCRKPQVSRCQGDDTFVAFQPMGILRFWRNGQFTFFQRCLQPLYFSQSPPPTQLNLPFCAGVQFSRDYIRAFKYMY